MVPIRLAIIGICLINDCSRMRLCDCAATVTIPGVIAFVELRDRPGVQAWVILMILIVVLFNPIIPVRLSRSTWFYLDLATAGVFTTHLFLVRP
jgi:surface polysaccharide O-acyltransferase-like enzyme